MKGEALLLKALFVRIIKASLGGAIGIVIGIIIGVLGILVMLIGGFAGGSPDMIFGAFIWACISAIGIPLLGIAGAIIGGIVKLILKILGVVIPKKSIATIGGSEDWSYIDGLFVNGDYDKVIEESTNAINANPNLLHGYGYRGRAHLEKGDISNAIADFTEVLRLDPNNASAYFFRGNAYLNANSEKYDADKAIADYNEAIRLVPTRADAYFRRGCAYFDKDDNDNGFADFAEAIRFDPTNKIVYFMRGNYHAQLGNVQEAIRDCENFLELDSDSEDAEHIRNVLNGLRSVKP